MTRGRQFPSVQSFTQLVHPRAVIFAYQAKYRHVLQPRPFQPKDIVAFTCPTFCSEIISKMASSQSTSTLIHLCLLEKVTKRLTKDNKIYYYGKGIIKENAKRNDKIKAIISNDEKTGDALTAADLDQFLMVTNVISTPTTIKTTEESEVFLNAAAFDVNQQTVNDFRNAPVLTIPDIYSSPPKRRVSVKGKVTHVGDLQSDTHYKRRRIVLTDEQDRNIDTKLWDEHAVNPPVKINDMIEAKTFTVDVYHTGTKSVTSLNSTPSSQLLCNDKPSTISLNIIAINNSQLITDDNVIYNHNLLQRDLETINVPQQMTVTITNNIVTLIHTAPSTSGSKEKKNKK
ncbi:uncharacterized protein [Ptychodera flava]|uniref:uncharacterized protein isoform X2 n=1 Tax=Ptychodera flava TaxID=63121 RepID=UPI00396AAB21